MKRYVNYFPRETFPTFTRRLLRVSAYAPAFGGRLFLRPTRPHTGSEYKFPWDKSYAPTSAWLYVHGTTTFFHNAAVGMTMVVGLVGR